MKKQLSSEKIFNIIKQCKEWIHRDEPMDDMAFRAGLAYFCGCPHRFVRDDFECFGPNSVLFRDMEDENFDPYWFINPEILYCNVSLLKEKGLLIIKKDLENCALQVEFPTLNISQKIPLIGEFCDIARDDSTRSQIKESILISYLFGFEFTHLIDQEAADFYFYVNYIDSNYSDVIQEIESLVNEKPHEILSFQSVIFDYRNDIYFDRSNIDQTYNDFLSAQSILCDN